MSLLSRWSGGLVVRFGPKLPLVVGSLTVAGGYLLFMRPGVGGNYWANFFPAVFTLGLGMAISVAPLTTTVMNAVSRKHAGIASGVNNAVARTASLIAIAVLGIVMLHIFNGELDRHLRERKVQTPIAESIRAQSTKLAAIEVPANLDSATRQSIRRAIDDSFISGFRAVMLIGGMLAALGAIVALLMVGGTDK
jgi:hypothetical protein